VASLIAQVSAAESKKASLELQLDAGRKQRTLLGSRVQDLELAAAAGEAELGRVKGELDGLLAKVDAAASAPVAAEGVAAMEVGDLCDSLVKAAAAYRSLFSAVQGRGVDAPYAASLNNVGALVWVEALLAGTADWMGVDGPGDDAGYTVVNALPELEGVPPALLRVAGGPVAQKLPLKRAAAGDGKEAAGGAATAAPTAAAAGEGSGKAVEGTAAAAAAASSPKAAAVVAAGGAVAAIASTVEAAAAAAAPAPEPPAAAGGGFEDDAFDSGSKPGTPFGAAPPPAAAATGEAAQPTAEVGFDEPAAFGRTSTADSAVLDEQLANPFASGSVGMGHRQSNATDSSGAFEDNAF